MRRHLIYAVLLLQLSFAAFAADDSTELQGLYSSLNMLNQQQQAIYQQFRMVQELRLSSAPPRIYDPPMPQYIAGELPNYDEVVEARRNAVQRGEYLYQQADALLARYDEIEVLKKPIQQRIYELSLKK